MLAHLYRKVYRHVAEMRWDALLLLVLVHFVTSWALAALTEPGTLTGFNVFWYYYFVTATTVGYGDFSPTTDWGRAVAVIWIMPGAIALFTTAIAKGAQAMAESWRRNMRGGGDFSKLDDHIVLIGWRGERSERLVDQLVDVTDSTTPEIVVLADNLSQNPDPDRLHFVRAENLSDEAAYRRSGLTHANAAIVMAATDADALAGALAAAAEAPELRLVVYFENERMATLLKAHCPMAETAPSMSIELLARAARDAGSAELLHMLGSSAVGPTEYSLVLPEEAKQASYGALMMAMKRDHDSTLLGLLGANDDRPSLNPPWKRRVGPGDRLYYVAEQRLEADDLDWGELQKMD